MTVFMDCCEQDESCVLVETEVGLVVDHDVLPYAECRKTEDEKSRCEEDGGTPCMGDHGWREEFEDCCQGLQVCVQYPGELITAKCEFPTPTPTPTPNLDEPIETPTPAEVENDEDFSW
jgi:hypothetical protein